MSKLSGHEGHHETGRREEHRGNGHQGDGDRQPTSTYLPVNDHSQDESDRLHAAVEANNVIRGGGIPSSTNDGGMADNLDLGGGLAMPGQYGGIDEVAEKIG